MTKSLLLLNNEVKGDLPLLHFPYMCNKNPQWLCPFFKDCPLNIPYNCPSPTKNATFCGIFVLQTFYRGNPIWCNRSFRAMENQLGNWFHKGESSHYKSKIELEHNLINLNHIYYLSNKHDDLSPWLILFNPISLKPFP